MVDFLETDDGVRLAYEKTQGEGVGVVFCGGFMSDMTGSKATALEAHCKERGKPFVRFDYMGHGQSSGVFAQGRIGSWAQNTIQILDDITQGSQILIGSSMGGWMMFLAALARPERVKGLIGIAAAPDFPSRLMWEKLNDDQRHELEDKGIIHIPSDYDEPYPIRYDFIQESREQNLLDDVIPVTCPVHLIHGMADADVPWEYAPIIANQLASDQVEISMVKSGEHSMSDESNITLILSTLDNMWKTVS